MGKLSDLRFKGEFRDYQKEILNHSNQLIKDGKIHIVAAPGSGKTTLGIELMSRLNSPALILAPTVTIRQQWGERIVDSFLPPDRVADEYISYNLKKPSLITCITYQALYAAFHKLTIEEESDDDNDSEKKDLIDFTGFDLLQTIKDSNIKTICLDEAHHLKNEWQKALESFISALGKQVTIIALTATPPYDSTPGEWKKYTSLCGEIDDEIYVPQLVSQNTLCPHQDYIYFNYPTDEETQIFNRYKQKALDCADNIISSQLFDDILENSKLLTDYSSREEIILENVKGFIALLCLAKYRGIKLPKKLVKLVSPGGTLPDYSLAFAETAFQFVIDKPDLFTEDVSSRLYSLLSENSLIEKKQVYLKSNDKLNKLLLQSTGKLNSINKIVQSESDNLNKELRMLILTDYIKKDLKNIIGSDEIITTLGTVPIFESVRRSCGEQVDIALLSGQLVIIPKASLSKVGNIAENRNIAYTYKELENTNYLEIQFSGSGKNKVAVITEAFEQGLFQVLVGTKSLLGEGWDSPCINSLILASFVGSFVLSNQMRGRAIRVDKNKPDKVSNIWNLVTVEPEFIYESKAKQLLLRPILEDKNLLQSDDYETLKRRFKCFLAPAYSRNIIQNGIERIDIIKPPFNKDGIKRINKEMLELSSDRDNVAERWNGALSGHGYTEILEMDEFTKSVQPQGFLFQNILSTILLFYVIRELIGEGLQSIVYSSKSISDFLLGIIVFAVLGYFFILGLIKIYRYLSPKKTIETLSRCVLKTLKDIHEIESKGAKVDIRSDSLHTYIYASLTNATMHEKYVFAEAMREMLFPIDNPRYILIKSYGFAKLTILKYSHCYACPSVIATKKENVEILASYLKRTTGKFALFYTRNELGRKRLLKCRKRSYINRNESYVNNRKVTKKWE